MFDAIAFVGIEFLLAIPEHVVAVVASVALVVTVVAVVTVGVETVSSAEASTEPIAE